MLLALARSACNHGFFSLATLPRYGNMGGQRERVYIDRFMKLMK